MRVRPQITDPEDSEDERLGRGSSRKGRIMAGAIGNAQGVDLNKASEQDLQRIGGIGEERAKRLVENRPYQSWEDLKKVEGFNEKLVEDLQKEGATLGRGGTA
jgi:hypothetical protein